MNTLKKQYGNSLLGWFVIGSMAMVIGVSALKLVPAYMEYYRFVSILESVQSEPSLKNASKKAIRISFAKRMDINDVTSIEPEDIVITKVKGKKAFLVEIDYDVTKPLFGNLSIIVNFKRSAEVGAGEASSQ